MTKFFLLFLLFSILIFPQSNTLVQSKIDKLLSDKFFESAQISVDIYNLEKQEVLYQKNNKLLQLPASNMKLLTSAAGLIFLTPSYQFKTSIFYTGEIINETLYGDLYLVGGCDPDFTSDDLNSLVEIIYEKEIREISGNIYADISMKDSLFWGNGWMWDDDPSTDAPYLSALNINDNAIGIAVKGKIPGEKAEIFLKPFTNYVSIINETETSSVLPEDYFVTRDWVNRKNDFIVKGTVNSDTSSLNENDFNYFNLFHPEDYFMNLFLEKLYEKGIKNNNEFSYLNYHANAEHLYTFSRSFDSVIVNLNKESDNLSSEMTLYALAEKFCGKPASAQNGLRLIDSLVSLFNFDPEDYSFADGSGVSRYNLVSAELLLNLLKYIYYYRKDLFYTFYNSLPVAGIDGTLRHRMIGTEAYNNVHAKTGTLSGVSTLSGYVTNSRGHLIAFSILIQNYIRNNSTARFFQDEVCRILAEN